MAVTVTSRTGKRVTLLNPAEKGDKFARELKRGYKRTNSGSLKLDKNKKSIKLTEVERAYRSGYLAARSDSAKCYNSKKKKRK